MKIQPKPVTMAEIDRAREILNEYIQIKRSIEATRQYGWKSHGWSEERAWVLVEDAPLGAKREEVTFQELLNRINGLRSKVDCMVMQWIAQDCKEAKLEKPRGEWCDCGSFGTHLKGEGVTGPCYNTGDAIGDLSKIVVIPDDYARRVCFEKWKRNYVKECRSAYAIDGMTIAGYHGGDVNRIKEQAVHVVLNNLGRKLQEAATIEQGPEEWRYKYDMPPYRVEARAIVLTNKKLDNIPWG